MNYIHKHRYGLSNSHCSSSLQGKSVILITRKDSLGVELGVTTSVTNSIYTSLFDTIHGGYSYGYITSNALFCFLAYDDQDFLTLRWFPWYFLTHFVIISRAVTMTIVGCITHIPIQKTTIDKVRVQLSIGILLWTVRMLSTHSINIYSEQMYHEY